MYTIIDSRFMDGPGERFRTLEEAEGKLAAIRAELEGAGAIVTGFAYPLLDGFDLPGLEVWLGPVLFELAIQVIN
jgi:hypothetical protein